MDLKDLMMLYGVTLGSRKTQRKKNLFVETVKICFSGRLRYACTVSYRSEAVSFSS